MKVEIERKFIVKTGLLPPNLPKGKNITQAYLSHSPVVRIRIEGKRGWLTVKEDGFYARNEYEYPVPLREARRLIGICPHRIVKVRRRIGRWEIDEFIEPKKGLWIAEIELAHDGECIEDLPIWCGDEVTYDPNYYNSNISGDMLAIQNWKRLRQFRLLIRNVKPAVPEDWEEKIVRAGGEGVCPCCGLENREHPEIDDGVVVTCRGDIYKL